MIESEKNRIRKELNNLRNSLDYDKQHSANIAICEKLSNLKEVISAKNIAAYMPMKNEVDLTSFFAKCAEKQLCFPRYTAGSDGDGALYEMALIPGSEMADQKNIDNCFITGKFGIPEPKSTAPAVLPDKIDVWLIPGVGFDLEGGRIGRGGGFYDRLLEEAQGIKIGVGYNIQLVKNIPCGEYDQRMNFVITEKRIIEI